MIKDTQDRHSELLGQFISVGESHTRRFDKADTSIAELKSAQSEQGNRFDQIDQVLQEILRRLPEGK